MKADKAKGAVKTAKGAVLTLPPELKISNNFKLIKTLKSALEGEYTKIIIDLSKLRNIDLSSIQILLVFYKECLGNNVTVYFKGPLSEKIEGRFIECGLMNKVLTRNGVLSNILFPFLGHKGAEIENC